MDAEDLKTNSFDSIPTYYRLTRKSSDGKPSELFLSSSDGVIMDQMIGKLQVDIQSSATFRSFQPSDICPDFLTNS